MVGMWKVTETTLLTCNKNKQDKSESHSLFLFFNSVRELRDQRNLNELNSRKWWALPSREAPLSAFIHGAYWVEEESAWLLTNLQGPCVGCRDRFESQGAQMLSTYSLPLTICILGALTEWLKQMRWRLGGGGRRAERNPSEAPRLHRVSALVLQGAGTGSRTKRELLHSSENQASEDNSP